MTNALGAAFYRVAALSWAALRLISGLADALFLATCGGLRPAILTGSPVLGSLDMHDGLLVATGHHRNGVLLCGITGEIIAALALGEPPPVDVSPFLHENLAQNAVQ